MFPTFTLVPDTGNPHKGDLSTSKTPVDLDKQALEGTVGGNGAILHLQPLLQRVAGGVRVHVRGQIA